MRCSNKKILRHQNPIRTVTRTQTPIPSQSQIQIRSRPTPTPLSVRGAASADHPPPHVVTGTEAQTMAVTVAETRGAIGMTVAAEAIPALHLPRAVLCRHPRDTVTTVRWVDVIRHLAVAVPLPLPLPLPGPGMTTGVTGTGTWIGAGRPLVTGITRRERIGTEETTGAGLALGIGP